MECALMKDESEFIGSKAAQHSTGTGQAINLIEISSPIPIPAFCRVKRHHWGNDAKIFTWKVMIKTSTTFISLKDESIYTQMMNGWKIYRQKSSVRQLSCAEQQHGCLIMWSVNFSLFFMSHYINEQAAGVESCDGLSRAAFLLSHIIIIVRYRHHHMLVVVVRWINDYSLFSLFLYMRQCR